MTSEADIFNYLPAKRKAPRAVKFQSFAHISLGWFAIAGAVVFLSLALGHFVHMLTPIETQTEHLLTDTNQERYDQLLLSDAQHTKDDEQFISLYEFAVESASPNEEVFDTAKGDFFTGISLGVAFLAIGMSVLLTEPSSQAKQREFEALESAHYLHAKLNYLKNELLYEGSPS